MFSLLRAAFTLLICVLIVGLYLGWFSFTKPVPDPQSNKVNVNVSVDKQKMGADLQQFERSVAKRIEDINPGAPGPMGSAAPLSGRPPAAPALSFGPITIQPSNLRAQPTNGQAGWSVGPFSVQPPPGAPGPVVVPSSPPGPPQSSEYLFTVPLGAPPPGPGR